MSNQTRGSLKCPSDNATHFFSYDERILVHSGFSSDDAAAS